MTTINIWFERQLRILSLKLIFSMLITSLLLSIGVSHIASSYSNKKEIKTFLANTKEAIMSGNYSLIKKSVDNFVSSDSSRYVNIKNPDDDPLYMAGSEQKKTETYKIDNHIIEISQLPLLWNSVFIIQSIFLTVLLICMFFIFSSWQFKKILHPISMEIRGLVDWLSAEKIEDLAVVEKKPSSSFRDVSQICDTVNKMALNTINIKKIEQEIITTNIAQQVAHDIRSPLSALQLVTYDLKGLPEEKRIMIRNASQRINDIANNLLLKSQTFHKGELQKNLVQEESSCVLLSSVLESIISEKRTNLRNLPHVQIDLQLNKNSYGLFASVQVNQLKRILSNLINNAVEALGDRGTIEIGLRVSGSQEITLYILDNGSGIPPEVLAKLGQRGVTHGKAGTTSGSGLGVYHAIKAVESWGGRLEIVSTLGKGSTFSLILPRQEAPPWFVPHIELAPDHRIVILDDDISIHQVWQGKFRSIEKKDIRYHLEFVSSPEDFRKSVSENSTSALYLCDYELLGFQETGLDLIETLAIQDSSILVTSRFGEKGIRNRCERLGVKCIPKELASFVPITFS